MKSDKHHPSEFDRYVLADVNGQCWEVTPDNYASCDLFLQPGNHIAMLKQFVGNELGHKVDTGLVPAHVNTMLRHQLVDYCEVSEKGHYVWYPNGLLMHRLIQDYALRLSRQWGAFEVKNPILIRGDSNSVGELMGEFHERDYKVDGGRGVCYLRYASDPLAFPLMHNIRFTYKQTPLKVYEEAGCFRNEQEGEVSGLKRVRGFMMSDMHAACATTEQANLEFEKLCMLFAQLMDDVIAPGRWVMGWEGTTEFFDDHKEWLLGLVTQMGVPSFFKLMPQMSHYYAIKNEYQCITADGSNVQVSTVQWDVKDGARFDIGYIADDGMKHACPVILHASSFGSIERALCAILETITVDASQGAPPSFPLWLAPTQVRVIPVSSDYLEYAQAVASSMNAAEIRCDIDDRNETVSKRVRTAEGDWVPYIAVVGAREASSSVLHIRDRVKGEASDTEIGEFINTLAADLRGMPFRPLALPVLVSQRPTFRG